MKSLKSAWLRTIHLKGVSFRHVNYTTKLKKQNTVLEKDKKKERERERACARGCEQGLTVSRAPASMH